MKSITIKTMPRTYLPASGGGECSNRYNKEKLNLYSNFLLIFILAQSSKSFIRSHYIKLGEVVFLT